MKKKVSFMLITLVIIIAGILIWIQINNNPKSSLDLKIDKINQMSISRLPVPPKTKFVKDKDEVGKVVNILNSFKIEKVKVENINGWSYSIIIQEGTKIYTILFQGEYLNVNDSYYKLKDKEAVYDSLDKIYKELYYEELNNR